MAESSIGRGTLVQNPRESRVAGLGGTDRERELEARVARLEEEARRRPSGAARAQFGPRSVLSVLGMIVLVGAILVLGYLAWKAIALVLIAILFALALSPAVEFFVARGLSRASAAAVVFVLTLCVVALLGLLLIPPLVTQVTRFVAALPDLVTTMSHGHGPLGAIERRLHLVEHVRGALVGSGSTGVAASGVNVVLGVAGTAVSIIIVSFLTFFMLLEGPVWTRRGLALFPAAHRASCERICVGIYRTVGGFVSGNLLASLLAGVAAGAVLVATGVPFAVPLALLVAFLDLLPIFGMIVALLVLAAVGFAHGVVTGIVVVGFVFVYHQFEVYLLRPLIYGRTVELSPLAVLVAVVVGTEMAGVIGALAAIPIAGALNVVLCELSAARADARQEEILDLSRPGPG